MATYLPWIRSNHCILRYPAEVQTSIDSGDRALIRIVDAALAEAARRSGKWLVCRPGCTECCMGLFPITQLDAHRLRRGLEELDDRQPERAARVRERARRIIARLPPGLDVSAIDDDFNDLDDEPCPALDPATGTCDLYASRPITCRAFGPPVSTGSGSIGICELCFEGASEEEVAACEVEIDPGGLEPELISELEAATGESGPTLVALALAD